VKRQGWDDKKGASDGRGCDGAGESWWAYFSGMNHDDTPGGLQKASMIDFSKRSILLFIFLFKEGSFVTAFFAALVIATLALVLGLVLGSIIVPIAYYGWLQNNKHAQIQFGGTVLQVYSVVSFQITVSQIGPHYKHATGNVAATQHANDRVPCTGFVLHAHQHVIHIPHGEACQRCVP
jgi:hypothetical protein